MTIDAPGTVACGAALTAAATLVAAFLWDRFRAVGRTLLSVVVTLLLSATCALQLNRLTVAYPSWSALVAAPSQEPALSTGLPVRPGGGRLLTVTVPGRASGLSLTMGVYLPAAYDSPEGAGRRFPVIEMFHGYPGSPSTWVRRLKVVQHLDEEILAGRMAPTVVLLPYQTPRRLLDTECTDLAGGPQTETFLTEDVATYAATHYRVRTDRAGWGLMGYSAGGFCAMNLALRHPHRYAAAASLSGDAGPGIKVGDGSENTTNNVAWRLQNLPQPRAAFYVAWAADDRESRDGSRAVVRLARPPLTVTAVELPGGGHSHSLWRRMESPALDWLSGHLARAVPVTR
ncbi:alpha/beta hydrolase [Nucisporomicrobium flavum]|uniref:alpha/beta hydrolase n=1 Tax=Nucisporomicrobium flavum TaxID=2785915 RepID=UPI0018F6DC91|nr:alpha/beta hydrolase-fold protein [Nucisporomicrobium flavum]